MRHKEMKEKERKVRERTGKDRTRKEIKRGDEGNKKGRREQKQGNET